MNYYLIVNTGTLINLPFAQSYPYQMILAQQWLSSSTFRNTVKEMQELYSPTIIFDNGAHEDVTINHNMYIALIAELRPTFFVLPDLVGRNESRTCSMAFLSQLRSTPLGRDILERSTPMYAPQGKGPLAVLNDYAWAIDNLPTKYPICFGQSYLQFCDSDILDSHNHEYPRTKLIDMVLSMRGATLHSYHILGGRWYVESNYRHIHLGIKGIDSIKPAKCTYLNTYYPTPPRLTATPPTPLNMLDNDTILSEELLRFNVHAFALSYGADHHAFPTSTYTPEKIRSD